GLALDAVELAGGLVRPTDVADPGDGSGRLFLVQQTGEILVWNGTSLEATPFLDLSGEVVDEGERGLLGLVFHPDYATNGLFFVNYTREREVDEQLQTVVARYEVSKLDPDVADPGSDVEVLVVDQPEDNHNAGDLAFGPDGFLYVPLGDGGGGGDPEENGQDLSTLLGSVLRIDPAVEDDPDSPYAVPPDNPFVGQAGARDEIWAYGLRNPFRISFDRGTGDLWIGDVGQNRWEEVDLQPASSSGGENYGWDCREGAHDFDDDNGDNNEDCPAGGFTDPVLEYFQEDGRCSVTGGFRYRGDAFPRLRGVYLYADFCTGEVFGTVPRCDGAWESRVLLDAPFNVTTFGEDAAGELYVSEYVGGNPAPPDSKVHRLVPAAGSGGPDLAPQPISLDFGEVEVGDTVRLLLTLENDNPGPEAASVAERTLSAPGRFTLDPAAGPAPCRSGARPCLPPEASCTLAVELQAETTGTLSETLTFQGNFLEEVVTLEADVKPCEDKVNDTVTDLTVSDGETETHRACDTLTAGPDVTVEDGGALTLGAGTRVVLEDGFDVESGGSVVLEVF
ncbi:MAG: PQQ-dependent sugar dehydrogenase, partial [Acidobacteriota bacterium]